MKKTTIDFRMIAIYALYLLVMFRLMLWFVGIDL